MGAKADRWECPANRSNSRTEGTTLAIAPGRAAAFARPATSTRGCDSLRGGNLLRCHGAIPFFDSENQHARLALRRIIGGTMKTNAFTLIELLVVIAII